MMSHNSMNVIMPNIRSGLNPADKPSREPCAKGNHQDWNDMFVPAGRVSAD